jgi:hypothetical protein
MDKKFVLWHIFLEFVNLINTDFKLWRQENEFALEKLLSVLMGLTILQIR